MRFQILVEFIVIIAAIVVIVTQLVIPAARGTKIFPFFRREKDIVDAMIDENQAAREAELARKYKKQADFDVTRFEPREEAITPTGPVIGTPTPPVVDPDLDRWRNDGGTPSQLPKQPKG